MFLAEFTSRFRGKFFLIPVVLPVKLIDWYNEGHYYFSWSFNSCILVCQHTIGVICQSLMISINLNWLYNYLSTSYFRLFSTLYRWNINIRYKI